MSMPEKIAVFGDVHGNIDALETVLEDCRGQGVDAYLCTGDVVGYGARPRECIAKVRELGCPGLVLSPDGKKARIDASLCTGCSLCAQICPVGAISSNRQTVKPSNQPGGAL